MEFVLNLTAERSVVRESLKGVIWTIFFHRLFGPITPVTNEFLNITYPMAADLPDLDSQIDDKINQLIRRSFDSNGSTKTAKTGHIAIQFLDKNKSKSKKKTGWFAKAEDSEELKVWEIWIIQVQCLPLDEPQSGAQESNSNNNSSGNANNSGNGNSSTSHTGTNNNNNNHNNNSLSPSIQISISSFEENLTRVIDIADSHKNHIPPIMTLESSPFPYVISLHLPEKVKEYKGEGNEEEESWGKYIKKMLD
ncbi:autophagy-related protein [Scheffersomyces xylosifermentans]|uniref:autophagy-related protein n=1 Tax=Scheffersomyces xylosifermentans TaxID=1304137 RepID=UPI00315C8BB7